MPTTWAEMIPIKAYEGSNPTKADMLPLSRHMARSVLMLILLPSLHKEADTGLTGMSAHWIARVCTTALFNTMKGGSGSSGYSPSGLPIANPPKPDQATDRPLRFSFLAQSKGWPVAKAQLGCSGSGHSWRGLSLACNVRLSLAQSYVQRACHVRRPKWKM